MSGETPAVGTSGTSGIPPNKPFGPTTRIEDIYYRMSSATSFHFSENGFDPPIVTLAQYENGSEGKMLSIRVNNGGGNSRQYTVSLYPPYKVSDNIRASGSHVEEAKRKLILDLRNILSKHKLDHTESSGMTRTIVQNDIGTLLETLEASKPR